LYKDLNTRFKFDAFESYKSLLCVRYDSIIMCWIIDLNTRAYQIWTYKDSQIHLFHHCSHDLYYISHIIFMSNEIILFQILYRPLKYLIFSLMKMRIINFILCRPCFINGPKFSNFWFFESFYITIGQLVIVTFIHFIHIAHKMFMVKILGQKIFEFFFLMG
jgi:hypothetical protein